MAQPNRDAALAAFKQTFRQLAPYRHRYEVFRDFVTMAACSLHNGFHKDDTREEEYLRIIGQYKADDQQAFPKLMAQLVAALDEEPRDILGPLYMELEIANKDAGQFFTPPELSELMAQMTFAQELDKLETQPFITAGEPAAGAGGMILALVKVMITAGHNPAEKLWVQAIDVDRMAALMCYVQLSLWNVPSEVIVGNTLSWDIREVWYKGLQDIGENLTQDQAAGFLLRLVFLWPAFIIVWTSSTTVAAALIETVAGSGTIFGEHGVRLFSLYSLLAYAIGFMSARVWYRSNFVRQRPIVGSLLGFASLIAAMWILKAIRPALGVLFGS